MSTPRSNPVKPRSRVSSRPLWLTIVLVVIGLLVLFGIGFGAASILGGSSSEADPTSSTSTSDPENCATIMVAPAESLPQASEVTLNVYNSTKRVGLAGDVAKLLGVRGFSIAKVENDPLGVPVEGVGEIRYGIKGEQAAELMAFHFPGAVLISDGRKGKRVDIALGKGFTELANDAEIIATLAKPTPSPSPADCASPEAAPSDPASESPTSTEPPGEDG